MPGELTQPGALPTFDAQPSGPYGYANVDYRQAGDQSGAIWGGALAKLSVTFGDMAQQSAKAAEEKAGQVAGLDPSYRPDGWHGEAFERNAAATHVNLASSGLTDGLADVYRDNWDNLAQNERDPQKLTEAFDKFKSDWFSKNVDPSIAAPLTEKFAALKGSYSRQALAERDKQATDEATASTLVNSQAQARAAHDLARLPTVPQAVLDQHIAEHAALLDEAVNQGQMTAVKAQALKDAFKQQVLVTRGQAGFEALPDSEKLAAFLRFAYGGDYLAQVAQKESNNGAAAGNGGGIYQFTAGTWANVRASHPELGLPAQVGQATRDEQKAAAGALTSDNGARLKASGFDTTPQNLYMAHFLGAGGASSFLAKLAAEPNGDAASAFPKEAAANRAVFYNADGSPKTFAQVYQNQTKGFGDGRIGGLSPDNSDWLLARMRHGVAQVQAAQDGATREGVAEIGQARKQIEGGEDMTPAAFSALGQKYSGSESPDVKAAFDLLSRERSMLAGFQGKTPAQVEVEVANLRAGMAEGAAPADVQMAKTAEGWLNRYRQDVAQNPVARFARDFGRPIAALDFSSPEALATSFAARAPVAEAAAEKYGMGPKYLTPDERAGFKSLAAEGGQPMIAAASAMTQALGPKAASVLKEIGGDAPTFAQAARVSAWGGDPGFLNDFAHWAELARDPATKKAMELPNRAAVDQEFQKTLGPSLMALPEINAAARTSAVQAFEVAALRNGWDKGLNSSDARAALNQALQKALGATYDGDTQYGGVATRKIGWLGSEQALAPGNMRADRLGEALGALKDEDLAKGAQKPVYADGSSVPAAAIAGSRLVSINRGQYLVADRDPLSKDATYLKGSDGKPYVLDLNAHEAALRARVPGLYR
jgi:hypothetical protein